jgi:polysaccharide deacetylase family protein (PEP-CTERM system associated)
VGSNGARSRDLRVHALTIDVEDWYHPELVRDHINLTSVEGRVLESVPIILDLLRRHEVKATFFILGEVARRFPQIVRQIDREGHELGCHGMSHRALGEMGEKEFRMELQDFQYIMKEIVGDVKIKGFRAPTFSLNQDTKWALPLLRAFGYSYDSSIFPTRIFFNRLYGIKNAPRFPYRISFDDPGKEDPCSEIWEFPAALMEMGGYRFPVSGGIYLRVLPHFIFKGALKRISKEGPFFIYLHPWEWDTGTPRISLSLFSRWATYSGLKSVLKKLERLLRAFPFSRMDEVLEKIIQEGDHFGATHPPPHPCL